MAKIPAELKTFLAWRFETVLPGSFQRNKQDYAGIEFPILGPLPTHKAATEPLEGQRLSGPFIYFVTDVDGEVRYVGKSKERTVIKRWVRPGVGGTMTHYWSHTNKSAGCVRQIAEGIKSGMGPFELRFISLDQLSLADWSRFRTQYPNHERLEQAEKGFQSWLRPSWNDQHSYK